MLPGTVEGMTHVCYFRHALALDERRVKFLPEYAYGGSTTDPATDSATEALKPIENSRGTWAAIQIVIWADPKLVQSPRGRFRKRRRFGLQGRTQICQHVLTYQSITDVWHLVAVET